ncbi:MAG: hypothetical protein AB1791_23725, partial [Chloroflexota bacterium]
MERNHNLSPTLSQDWLTRLVDVLLLLLGLSLPFEVIRPLWRFPWFAFTNLELLAVLTILVGGIAVVAGSKWQMAGKTCYPPLATCHLPLPFLMPRPLLLPATVFLLTSLLSAALAPTHHFE